MTVRHPEGSLRGFLELQSDDGHTVAIGDLEQAVRGDRVYVHLVFHFKDGSLDDETTAFSQSGVFRLISDHHIQQGPSFPQPQDMTIDVRAGRITVRSKDKDGKQQVKSDAFKFPPDLVNGMVRTIAENIPPSTTDTRVKMFVATPKPRLVTLVFSARGEEPFSVAGSRRTAMHYAIKIDLGGVAGVVAPVIGRQPPDIEVWVTGGDAPLLVRERGPLAEGGPVWTMQEVSPVWPDEARQ
jgi:hypothetical protein